MLNENIKTLRKNKGFTQEELASRLHVTRQTISKWQRTWNRITMTMAENWKSKSGSWSRKYMKMNSD